MTIANALTVSDGSLPAALRAAQEAIHLPEVQEILCRLSKYKLGIYMPHMHDEGSGDFRALPDDVIQVESGLEVSFESTRKITNQGARFLPWGGFGVRVQRHPRQYAKWMAKKNQAIQSATSNITCLKEISVMLHPMSTGSITTR